MSPELANLHTAISYSALPLRGQQSGVPVEKPAEPILLQDANGTLFVSVISILASGTRAPVVEWVPAPLIRISWLALCRGAQDQSRVNIMTLIGSDYQACHEALVGRVGRMGMRTMGIVPRGSGMARRATGIGCLLHREPMASSV